MADTSLNENRIGLLVWQTCNIWQTKLRKILKKYNISLNEYLIIETLFKLSSNMNSISQTNISNNSFIDISVVSTTLSLLEKKKIIIRNFTDNRTKKIELTQKGMTLISSLSKIISNEESIIFSKLGNESYNFINSLKLILGKKIRVKAHKSD